MVAADYICNLTMEGIIGRLRQHPVPLLPPVGYMNNGGGKVKAVDPVTGPLVKEAFELYATREYSLQTLANWQHFCRRKNRLATQNKERGVCPVSALPIGNAPKLLDCALKPPYEIAPLCLRWCCASFPFPVGRMRRSIRSRSDLALSK